MASNEPFDLDYLQDLIHTFSQSDEETPESDDPDYLVRTRLINGYIMRWENYDGTLWKELWTTTTGKLTGDLLTVDGTADYAAPDDFRFAGGYVYLRDGNGLEEKYPVVKPDDLNNIPASSQRKYAYFTGSQGDGYTLHLSPTTTSANAGWTIYYPYYKYATKLVDGSDKPEMSNPMYLVHAVSAELYKSDDNYAGYTSSLQTSEEDLKAMKYLNMSTGPFQSNEVQSNYFGNLGQ